MQESKPRILIVDDNEALHQDFQLVLAPKQKPRAAATAREKLFGQANPHAPIAPNYHLDSAFQGENALEMVLQSHQSGSPYAMAFIDMRMPPGWDGLETISRIHKADDDIQIVLCTAYSDYSWHEIQERIGATDRLLILKKPFDNAEVSQLAAGLCRKHVLAKHAATKAQELEHLVHERTAEITVLAKQKEQMQIEAMEQERRLIQKQKLESLGMLAGGVAHDVNNLLHVVRSYIELTNKHVGDDDVATRYLSQSCEVITEISAVVNRILDFSRRQPSDLKQINVADAIERARKLVEPLATQSNHDVETVVHLPTTGTYILCEPSLIEQTIVNLCINGCDAMTTPGRIKISACTVHLSENEICPDEELQPGEYLQLEVADQGTGMSEEVQNKIFDPFFTTKTEGRGTGLGLATIHGTVRRHHGRVDVQSKLGEGSTFRVLLPLQAIDHPADSQPTDSQPTDSPAIDSLTAQGDTNASKGQHEMKTDNQDSTTTEQKTIKILVADDAAPIREIAKLVLEGAGYRPIMASNGQQALDLATEHEDIAVLVLDVQMPLLDGHQVVQKLKAAGRNIPVIYCSGYDPYQYGSSEIVSAVTDAMRLDKPFSVDELLNSITKALNNNDSNDNHKNNTGTGNQAVVGTRVTAIDPTLVS